MLLIYQELFPEICLLALASSPHRYPEAALARHLHGAAHSRRPAVWIDCRLLDTVSVTDGRLLRVLHACLRRRQAHLVLCHVSERLANQLRTVGAVPASGFALANSLDGTISGYLTAE